MAARAGLKVFQSHGQRDPLLPFFIAEALRDQLRQAGLAVEFCPLCRSARDSAGLVLRAASTFLRSALSAPVPASPPPAAGTGGHV